jgi:hypothetical protein
MSHKFQAEDFYDVVRSLGALGSFEQDLGDFSVRNSDKYKEGCKHLHLDMLAQELLVVDMDTMPSIKELHPFKLLSNEMLIGLQSDNPNLKRMLSVTRYQPDEGEPDEMIIVPLLASQQRHLWSPAGIVVFLKNLDDPDSLRIRSQEFPGANAGADRQKQLTAIVLDATNTIATVMASGKATMTKKVPSKLKLERSDIKDAATELRPFTLMSIK